MANYAVKMDIISYHLLQKMTALELHDQKYEYVAGTK